MQWATCLGATLTEVAKLIYIMFWQFGRQLPLFLWQVFVLLMIGVSGGIDG